jgi:TonB family protein
MAAELMGWLLRSALALAVVVCMVMALRPLWRRWLGAGAVLWLYLLVPAALVATSLPGPTLVSDAPPAAIAHPAARSELPTPGSTPTTAASEARSDERARATTSAFPPPETPLPDTPLAQASLLTVGLLVWAAGLVALAGLLWRQQRRFRRRLGHMRRLDAGLWQASTDDIGPVVIGLWWPRIVVPADFDHRYDPQQRELVLAHERVHLGRGDLPMNALACVLRCVFWFNPFVHLAAARLRLDQELACDAVVLARNPRAGRAYAAALLNTQMADLGLPVGCAWQSSHPLKWRISMLQKPSRGPARMMLGAALAVLTSSAAATALWQQQPATLITLPAIAMAASPAAMPPLPAIGRIRMTLPEPVLPPVFADAAEIATPEDAAAASETLPVLPSIAEPTARDLAPTTTLRGEISAPEPQVSSASEANAAAVAADYIPPRVRISLPGKLPPGARRPPPLVLVNGEIVRDDERFLRPPGREALLRRDVRVSDGLILQVSLDATGKLVDAQVHENRLGERFARNALSVIRHWRFEPARRAGQAVSSTVLVPVWFEWDDGGAEAFRRNEVRHPLPTGEFVPQAGRMR